MSPVEDALSFVKPLVGDNVKMLESFRVKMVEEYRCWFDDSINTLGIGTGPVEPRIMVHELGHAIEDSSPQIKAKMLDYLGRRTKGLKAIHPSGPGWDADEMFIKDKFADKYFGKVAPAGERYTEVLSMSLQKIYEDPAAFLREDPETFHFVTALLRGET